MQCTVFNRAQDKQNAQFVAHLQMDVKYEHIYSYSVSEKNVI